MLFVIPPLNEGPTPDAHETIAENRDIIFRTMKLQSFQIDKAIIIRKTHIFSTVTTLGNMVRNIRKDTSGYSRHNTRLRESLIKG